MDKDSAGQDIGMMIPNDDENLVKALVHHADMLLKTDRPENSNREGDLDSVKKSIRLAETILSGRATDDERGRVRDVVHPQVRSLYRLDAQRP